MRQRICYQDNTAALPWFSHVPVIFGRHAVAVDHRRLPGAACHVHLVDLCTAEGVELVRRWLAMPNCVGIWFAPPCGTASRAREVKGVPGPPPLRSEKFPNGVPQLGGQALLRVTLANQLYDCVSDLVLEAASRDLVIGVENPRQSFYWRTSMFARIAHLFQFTAFQSCAYGDRRPKWTAIAYTRGAFDGICKSCPGHSCAQRHLPWGVAPDAPNGFLLPWKLHIHCHWPVLWPKLSFRLARPDRSHLRASSCRLSVAKLVVSRRPL